MNRLDELYFKLYGKAVSFARQFSEWLEDFINGK